MTLAARVHATNHGNRIEIEYKIKQDRYKLIEYRVNYKLLESGPPTSKPPAPSDLDEDLEKDLEQCLIYFEGDLHHVKKRILTHWENLEDVCDKIARFFDPIALADFLASIPILPLGFESLVRLSVVEDVAAEAAWHQPDSSTQSDASDEEAPDEEDSQPSGSASSARKNSNIRSQSC
ncbi:hypothetical protein GUITHDRAFT_109659 [Guillardia theta CCMP2712]|uniref:Uncharacterized protein n=2 Tax=Guillardia theta TaxID=55529 RepID=L1J8W2_GUITC|nr:hypothetical protein GUITHDRAFT_109659 [Guillardia theta CCMP2712]EKX44544.1 hypothetical protein GUITHDRAFT_109659 [Guillardia theta CCMP2712]|eukprot:XP_005831524.1 hypothetical protein GUITHDRAFT_109659 [Guillardia theta CCMP2712]